MMSHDVRYMLAICGHFSLIRQRIIVAARSLRIFKRYLIQDKTRRPPRSCQGMFFRPLSALVVFFLLPDTMNWQCSLQQISKVLMNGRQELHPPPHCLSLAPLPQRLFFFVCARLFPGSAGPKPQADTAEREGREKGTFKKKAREKSRARGLGGGGKQTRACILFTCRPFTTPW